MTDPELLQFVEDFRRGLLAGRSSAGMCYVVSAPLEGLLSLQGVECCLEEASLPEVSHWYLRLGDARVLDPTADQFPELVELPAVYLGVPAAIHNSEPQ